MMQFLASLFASLLAMTVLGATVIAKEVDDAALIAVVNSNLDFTNSFYKIVSRAKGNLLFSPLSIHTNLALVAQGARGATEQEMIQGLQLPQDKKNIKDGFGKLIHLIRSTINSLEVFLIIENTVFTDKRFPIKEEFAATVRNDFMSYYQQVDFTKSEKARTFINHWVEENTADNIKDLLEKGSIDSDTSMVLVNAVYFTGNWETKFDPNNTIKKPFYVSEHETKEVSMMVMETTSPLWYKDSSHLDAQILEIPYVGGQVSLIIVLPNDKNGIADLEAKLVNIVFSNITGKGFVRKRVYLELPKFKIELSIDLQKPLEELGMRQMFSNTANFSGLADGKLYVSNVVTKTHLEVTENGTVAAAASGSVGSSRSFPVSFVADHPFIFYLVSTVPNNTPKMNVLFMGRYSQP